SLLAFLRTNALETARSWPSWEQASQLMAGVLTKIASEPAPSDAHASARMLADLRGGIEIYHGQLRERTEYARRAQRYDRVLGRIRRTAAVRLLAALRRSRAVKVIL